MPYILVLTVSQLMGDADVVDGENYKLFKNIKKHTVAKSALPRGLPAQFTRTRPSRDHDYHINLPNQYCKDLIWGLGPTVMGF